MYLREAPRVEDDVPRCGVARLVLKLEVMQIVLAERDPEALAAPADVDDALLVGLIEGGTISWAALHVRGIQSGVRRTSIVRKRATVSGAACSSKRARNVYGPAVMRISEGIAESW